MLLRLNKYLSIYCVVFYIFNVATVSYGFISSKNVFDISNNRRHNNLKIDSNKGIKSKKRASADKILRRQVENDLLIACGYRFIIGVDEAGRGPIAGINHHDCPVVATALVCKPDHINLIQTAADSKVLSEKKREEIYKLIKEDPSIAYSFSVATMLAMKNSIDDLLLENNDLLEFKEQCYAVIDGNRCPNKLDIKSKSIIRGDALVYPIALASIVAKVERDHFMVDLDLKYPEYGFAQHKGYPTKKHILALHKHGPSEYHRITFGPVKGRSLRAPITIIPTTLQTATMSTKMPTITPTTVIVPPTLITSETLASGSDQDINKYQNIAIYKSIYK